MKTTEWASCYDESWKGWIVDEAFAHPAKMARALLQEIFCHLKNHYGLTKGALIVDPFGGIGSTAIVGASQGYQVVCCELEPKFVALAEKNFELHRRTWETFGDPLPCIVQGDSRKLREVLGPVLAECVVSSPPYAESSPEAHSSGIDLEKNYVTYRASGGGCSFEKFVASRARHQDGYGSSPGQLGSMKPGDVDAVIASPPFNNRTDAGPGPVDGWNNHAGSCRAIDGAECGDTPGQLGAMPTGSVEAIVSSPPYADGKVAEQPNRFVSHRDPNGLKAHEIHGDQYGASPGQLAALPAGCVDACVSSPPFQDQNACHDPKYHDRPGSGKLHGEYGDSAGQLGNSTGETFWSAAAEIVRECYAILKPGGIAVWVVKSFVRDGRIQDFPGDWRRLCEHAGFETIEEIHASLVKEETHAGLFGEHKTRKERKSFFRRLHEKKRPDLAIDFETVYFMRKAQSPPPHSAAKRS